MSELVLGGLRGLAERLGGAGAQVEGLQRLSGGASMETWAFALVGGTSSRLRRVQNGFARSYALTMLAGVVAILGAVWVIQ